jgi:predicted MPP superfamily phosphohydrolase
VSIAGWPLRRPIRIAFLSDLHAGSHADDVARLTAIVKEAAAFKPDLVLHGGDFVNMQLFGGGRLSPYVVARVLAPLDAPLGRFAVLGNHDYNYGAEEITAALMNEGITVLHDEKCDLAFGGSTIELIGLPDTRRLRDGGRALLAGLSPETPTIVLTHDPYWFAYVPKGPNITLAGHTHGGQIRLPAIGPLRNASRAPLRWTHGFVREDQRLLYVTGGLGTSGIPVRIGIPPEYAILEVSGTQDQGVE